MVNTTLGRVWAHLFVFISQVFASRQRFRETDCDAAVDGRAVGGDGDLGCDEKNNLNEVNL